MNLELHRLLQRQMKKVGLSLESCDQGIKEFISMINEAYSEFDKDRELLEHAIEITSEEMSKTNSSLHEAVISSQKLAQFRSNFLANMSHEIRTPMNGIIGLAEMIREKTTQPDAIDLIDLLTRSARGLVTIINDVLDLSKIEAGKLSMAPRVTNLRTLVTDLSAIFSAASREKDIELVTEIEDSVPQEILIDDGRLRQILTNLVGNALKFTPEHGGLIIHSRLETNSKDGELNLIITVSDTGIGIGQEDVNSIFEAFCQVNSSHTRQFGGTGLGLTISQQLAQLMGGSIELRSKLGVGSTFQLRLPLLLGISKIDRPELSTVKLAPKIDKGKFNLLLTEDNPVNQKVALHALNKLGFKVELADNGHQAVKKCSEKKFDLILMDCQMPGISGFEATSLIRTLANYKNTPIIALTALAMEGDKEKCLNSGMTDYISKPFKREELERIITKSLLQKCEEIDLV